MRNVFIRTDASIQIGSGHVMRCLTLAKKLREHRTKISFICREHPGNLIDYIQENGFKVHRLSLTKENSLHSDIAHHHWLGSDWRTDADSIAIILQQEQKLVDWLICDHYALDYHWEEALRPFVKRIMIIDDLADRKHDCNALLDQNFYLQKNRYQGLVPNDCIQLLGPQYVLLREEFIKTRKNLRTRTGNIKRILVFITSVDEDNVTGKVLEAIQQLNRHDIIVDIVLGKTNPHRKAIVQKAKLIPNFFCYIQVKNMGQLMAQSDLAIGAGGSTTWERLCLGLPSILFTLADNQIETTQALSLSQVVYYLGCSNNVSSENLSEILQTFLKSPELSRKMIKKGMELVDGQGTNRILQVMLERAES